MSSVQPVVRGEKFSDCGPALHKAGAKCKAESLRIVFAIKHDHLSVRAADVVAEPAPAGDRKLSKEISSGIIGYWIEMTDQAGAVLYRRFLGEFIPVNYFQAAVDCPSDSDGNNGGALRQHTIELLLPVLPNAFELRLYEQSIPAPGTKIKQRYLHLKAQLQALI